MNGSIVLFFVATQKTIRFFRHRKSDSLSHYVYNQDFELRSMSEVEELRAGWYNRFRLDDSQMPPASGTCAPSPSPASPLSWDNPGLSLGVSCHGLHILQRYRVDACETADARDSDLSTYVRMEASIEVASGRFPAGQPPLRGRLCRCIWCKPSNTFFLILIISTCTTIRSLARLTRKLHFSSVLAWLNIIRPKILDSLIGGLLLRQTNRLSEVTRNSELRKITP